MLLPPGASTPDVWGAAESGLTRALRENPELERRLLEAPAEDLAPADLVYRALVLDDRGDFLAARELRARADVGLYAAETRRCRERLLDDLVARFEGRDGPIVDLASGRCTLVEDLLRRLERPVVATDASPLVLFRSGRALAALGLADRLELLALDARRAPFRDGAVETLTSFVGLSNVEHPGPLLDELRRIVGGRLLAVCTFYPPGDGNADAIRRSGLERVLDRDSFLAGLEAAGFAADVVASCRARALPTPTGVVLEGAVVDALPVAETELEWALVEAS